MSLQSNYPIAQGLYDPANEHDARGVAMVATLNKIATHEIVAKGLTALRNLEHRGASGAEPDSGDGAGILICIPDAADADAGRQHGAPCFRERSCGGDCDICAISRTPVRRNSGGRTHPISHQSVGSTGGISSC